MTFRICRCKGGTRACIEACDTRWFSHLCDLVADALIAAGDHDDFVFQRLGHGAAATTYEAWS